MVIIDLGDSTNEQVIHQYIRKNLESHSVAHAEPMGTGCFVQCVVDAIRSIDHGPFARCLKSIVN